MRVSASGVFAIAALALVGWVAYEVIANKKKIADAAKDVGKALNPTSDQNVAYKAANSVVQSVTGVPDDTLGTALFRVFNSGQEAKDNEITSPVKLPTAQSLADEISGSISVGKPAPLAIWNNNLPTPASPVFNPYVNNSTPAPWAFGF